MLSLKIETNIAQSLNSAYVRLGASQLEIDIFKHNLADFFARFNENESEEYLKNLIADLLKNTWYKSKFEINTKDRKDLVIHNGKSAKDTVGVIIETKTIKSTERITLQDANTKSLHELILYYFDEREAKKNIEVKYLIATTGYEWFVFDENDFDKIFYRNKDFTNLYNSKKEQKKDNPFFYKQAAKLIEEMENELPCTYFNLLNFKSLKNDNEFLPLYKILSPPHLLKQPFANDSNSLNQEFYNELLHIMGLEEVKDGGKKIIIRQTKTRHDGSLIENTINLLKVQNKLAQIPNLAEFGDTEEEQIFSVGLELVITWLNRILFLKLLEGQLIKYHNNSEKHIPIHTPTPAFLHSKLIIDFNDLDELFFEVLALETHLRNQTVKEKYGNLPYLNSSLFEETELEHQTFHIHTLKHRLGMPFYEQTVLKDIHGKTLTDKKGEENQTATSTLDYLFRFLDAYDFSSEPTGQIRAESKTIINAAVLGLIFEKINGYKDGSFFTPGFITMYMCRETISRAVLQKFSKHFNETFSSLADLKSYIAAKVKWNEVYKLNAVFNTIKICDPAVGSGHFLVSAINELIAIKSELGILVDIKNNHVIQGLDINIDNDELEISYFRQTFNYNFHNDLHQNIQETIFHEKQLLIENCIFGVDINAKSVMICRLRLWIELLKNAYYLSDQTYKVSENRIGLLRLQTLPNLDINIKVGNSLVSRFDLKNNFLSKNEASRKKQTLLINKYKEAVFLYKTTNDKKLKFQVTRQIKELKEEFKDLVIPNDADYKKLKEIKGKLEQVIMTFDSKDRDEREVLVQQLAYYEKLVKEKQQSLYGNAFEWRFEFPEVLDDNGDFMGFDVVVANPPYGVKAKEKLKNYYTQTYISNEDIYTLFIQHGLRILNVNSNLGLITPTTWLTGQNYFKIRENISSNFVLTKAITLPYNIFKEAYIDTGIYFFNNPKELIDYDISTYFFPHRHKLNIKDFGNIKFGKKSITDWKSDMDLKLIFDDLAISILQKKGNEFTKLEAITKSIRGILAHKNDYSDVKIDNSFKPFFNGEANRYSLLLDKKKFVKYHEGLLEKPKDYTFFQGDRLLIRRIISRKFRVMATFTKLEFVNKKDLYVFKILNKDFAIKFVLGILNSKLISFSITKSSNSAHKDDFTQITLSELRNLPIPNIPLEAQQPFIKLVDKILKAKEKDPKADTLALETEIDQLVYQLYNLSPEEIAIVEESYKKTVV